MRGLRARAVITQWALYLTTSNNCYCGGVTVSIITRFSESVGILIQVSMWLFDPHTWLHTCAWVLSFSSFLFSASCCWWKTERAFFSSYRDAAVLSRDCLGFLKCAAAELKRTAQLLFSAAVALLCSTLGSPEQFVRGLLLFNDLALQIVHSQNSSSVIMNCFSFKPAFCSLM